MFWKWAPSPSIYRPRTPCAAHKLTANTPGMPLGANREAQRGRPGSTGPKAVRPNWTHGSATPCGPDWPPPLAWWLACGSLGTFSVCIGFWVSFGPRGPFNPCDVHLAASDLSGLPPLDWWHVMDPWDSCVAAPHWLRWRCMDHRRWFSHSFYAYFPVIK